MKLMIWVISNRFRFRLYVWIILGNGNWNSLMKYKLKDIFVEFFFVSVLV